MKGKEKNKNSQNTSSNSEIVKIKEKKSPNAMIQNWLIRTPLTILLIAIIIACYIGLNFLVEKLNIENIDLTAEKVYTLSERSKSLISSVDKDVNILLINLNSSNQPIIDFAYKYSSLNDKVKVEEIYDLTKRPDLTETYGVTNEDTAIIVKSESKEKLLTLNDFYTYDYTTSETKDVTEEAFTNAIIYATTSENPKIYHLSGHEKYPLNYMSYFIQDLMAEGNEFEELDLLSKGKVPSDCSALMITTLKEDIKETEKNALLEYIKIGGDLIIFSDPNVNNIKMPNFQKVLDEYCVSISNGVLLEQDSDRMLYNSPSAILVIIPSSTSVIQQTDMNMNALFINSGKLILKSADDLDDARVSLEVLAGTSAKAFHRTDLTIQSDKRTEKDDKEDSSLVGALLTKKIDDNTKSKLIIYSNNAFLTNIPVSPTDPSYALDYYNNEDLALNSIAYLTERENYIISRKTAEVTTYNLTKKQENTVLAVIFTVPVVIMISGIVVWQVRRRKK